MRAPAPASRWLDDCATSLERRQTLQHVVTVERLGQNADGLAVDPRLADRLDRSRTPELEQS